NLFGDVKNVCCLGATHIPQRFDEQGKAYKASADDAAYALFELDGGVIATLNSSWCVRVRRDDLVTFQVDGTHGSAVAGLTDCRTQARVNTPKPIWNPDIRQPMNFYDGWEEVPDTTTYDNGFKVQWELYIRHVVEDAAAHVVPDPRRAHDPWVDAAIDWDATIAYRRHLWSLGLGVAEAMDTAQRGMGLDWPTSLELIGRALDAARDMPGALIASG